MKFLPVGVYHYKFLVNGESRHSPDLPVSYDENGNGINILEVEVSIHIFFQHENSHHKITQLVVEKCKRGLKEISSLVLAECM